jgi:hypothetical protein
MLLVSWYNDVEDEGKVKNPTNERFPLRKVHAFLYPARSAQWIIRYSLSARERKGPNGINQINQE